MKTISKYILTLIILASLFTMSNVFVYAVDKPYTVLPTPAEDTGTAAKNCIDLGQQIIEGTIKDGEQLSKKLQCGKMSMGDILFYINRFLYFIFSIVGTLAVIAIMRSGYIFMASSDKETGEGRKAITAAVIGLLIVIFSFTIAQLVFSLLESIPK